MSARDVRTARVLTHLIPRVGFGASTQQQRYARTARGPGGTVKRCAARRIGHGHVRTVPDERRNRGVVPLPGCSVQSCGSILQNQQGVPM